MDLDSLGRSIKVGDFLFYSGHFGIVTQNSELYKLGDYSKYLMIVSEDGKEIIIGRSDTTLLIEKQQYDEMRKNAITKNND